MVGLVCVILSNFSAKLNAGYTVFPPEWTKGDSTKKKGMLLFNSNSSGSSIEKSGKVNFLVSFSQGKRAVRRRFRCHLSIPFFGSLLQRRSWFPNSVP
jgi:hypothetical protein